MGSTAGSPAAYRPPAACGPGGGTTGADDWMLLVERTLRGRPVEELASVTRDGIEVRPLYTDGPGRPSAIAAAGDQRRSSNRWDIRQGLRVAERGDGSSADTRDEAEQDISGGATSLELELPGGVDADAAEALLDSVLERVDLSTTPVALAPHARLEVAQALLEVAVRRCGGLAPGSSLGIDPVGEWARSGSTADRLGAAAWAAAAPEAERTGVSRRLETARPTLERPLPGGTGLRIFTVDVSRYSDAGATEAQALGWATATGIAYLRALAAEGVPVDSAAASIGFRLAATADQFVTIAALRAARVMWARVVTASGGSEEAARQYQHAVTAAHTYSRRDPWVNLLRGAAAALSAGVGGADAVTVLPFDHASGPVDAGGALGRRLARNTQLLLLEESHLGWPADPAGGSFYVESLTEQLASQGWRVLQDIEASGGIEAAIDNGSLAAAMEGSWRSRMGALRTRAEPLTGVSEFPLLDEPSPAVRGADEAAGAAGLPIRRLSEPFEDLRDAADRHHADTGDRPAVWIAALGPAAAHSARTSWTQNLLAAGGIEARSAAGVDSPVAAAADFAMSGVRAAVIAGTDDMYRLRGPATASALTEAGAAFVALACDPGTPAELLEDLRSAGVDEIWHDGIDIVSALERLHGALGVRAGMAVLEEPW